MHLNHEQNKKKKKKKKKFHPKQVNTRDDKFHTPFPEIPAVLVPGFRCPSVFLIDFCQFQSPETKTYYCKPILLCLYLTAYVNYADPPSCLINRSTPKHSFKITHLPLFVPVLTHICPYLHLQLHKSTPNCICNHINAPQITSLTTHLPLNTSVTTYTNPLLPA